MPSVSSSAAVTASTNKSVDAKEVADALILEAFNNEGLLIVPNSDEVADELVNKLNKPIGARMDDIKSAHISDENPALQLIATHYDVFAASVEKLKTKTLNNVAIENSIMYIILRNIGLVGLIQKRKDLFVRVNFVQQTDTPDDTIASSSAVGGTNLLTVTDVLGDLGDILASNQRVVGPSIPVVDGLIDITLTDQNYTLNANVASPSTLAKPVGAVDEDADTKLVARKRALASHETYMAYDLINQETGAYQVINPGSNSETTLTTTPQMVAKKEEPSDWLKELLNPLREELNSRSSSASNLNQARKARLISLYLFLGNSNTEYNGVTEYARTNVPSIMIGDWLDSVPALTASNNHRSNLELLYENRSRMVKRDIPKTLAFVLSNMTPEMKAFYECKAKMLSKIDEAAYKASDTNKCTIWANAARDIRNIKFDTNAGKSINALKNAFNTATTTNNGVELGQHTRKVHLGATFSAKQMSKVVHIVDIAERKATTLNHR